MRDLRRLPVRLINAIRASMTTVATGSAPISNLIFFSVHKYIVNQVCISHATACVIILDGAHHAVQVVVGELARTFDYT
jgi:hypothetical protein